MITSAQRPLMDPMAAKVRQRLVEDAQRDHFARFDAWRKAEDERFRREYPDLVLTDEELHARRMYYGSELEDAAPLHGPQARLADAVIAGNERHK